METINLKVKSAIKSLFVIHRDFPAIKMTTESGIKVFNTELEVLKFKTFVEELELDSVLEAFRPCFEELSDGYMTPILDPNRLQNIDFDEFEIEFSLENRIRFKVRRQLIAEIIFPHGCKKKGGEA